MKKVIAICLLTSLISAGAAHAASTLTFDELPFQPADGLNYGGVTFGFTVDGSPSTNAYYGAIGPGTLAYLQDETLVGDAQGILTLDFDSPVDLLQFGLALNTTEIVTSAYQVQLFDKSLASIGIFSGNTAPLIYWSESLFTFSGAEIGRAVIDINQSYARKFAIDNLTINQAPPASTVPAPGAVILGSLGVSFVGWLRRRKTL